MVRGSHSVRPTCNHSALITNLFNRPLNQHYSDPLFGASPMEVFYRFKKISKCFIDLIGKSLILYLTGHLFVCFLSIQVCCLHVLHSFSTVVFFYRLFFGDKKLQRVNLLYVKNLKNSGDDSGSE